nr:MAG TPA: hypothetical protein [Caudoviricetes sp.]
MSPFCPQRGHFFQQRGHFTNFYNIFVLIYICSTFIKMFL